MASAQANDPFYLVRDTLEQEVRQLQLKFERWRQLLQTVNTATDVGFKTSHDEIRKDVTKTEEMCRKVKQAVMNIQMNRARFPHIDDRELANRRQFVDTLERAVTQMKDSLNSQDTRAKLEADQRKEMYQRQEQIRQDAARQASAYTQANTDFMKSQQQQQTQVRREQDESLDKMGNTLDTLNQMAVTINNELEDQAKIIDDLDRGVDEAQGKMDSVIRHVEKLLQTKDRCQLMAIGGLTLLFIVVAIIAFYRLTG